MSHYAPRRFIITRSRVTDGKIFEEAILIRRDAAARQLARMIRTAAEAQGIGDRPFTRRKIREANKFKKQNGWWHTSFEILDQEVILETSWHLDDEGNVSSEPIF